MSIDITNLERIPILTFIDEPLLVADLARDLHQTEKDSGLVIDQVRFWPEDGRTIRLYVDGRLVASEDYAGFIDDVWVTGLVYFLNVYEIHASTVRPAGLEPASTKA